MRLSAIFDACPAAVAAIAGATDLIGRYLWIHAHTMTALSHIIHPSVDDSNPSDFPAFNPTFDPTNQITAIGAKASLS